MKLVSWNVNGLRACVKKGFLEYFHDIDADIFCIQETKLQEGQIDVDLPGYLQYWNYAEKKGYSGTAVFTKYEPLTVSYGFSPEESEREGRIITLEYENFYLVNVYTPNSQRDLARLEFRLEWEDQEENFDQRLIEEGKELLSNPVAYLPKKLETDWFHHTELNQLLCASLTEWCEADCSFLNAGVLLDHLGPGIVTDYDIHRICPHPINPCTVRLTGAELKEVIVQTVDDKYTTLEIKGFGFRGSIFGKIIYDQIEISGQGSAIKIQINGEDLQMERNYTVATLDMFTFARFYPEITRAEKKYYLPEFLRDLLRWKLKCNYPVKSEY